MFHVHSISIDSRTIISLVYTNSLLILVRRKNNRNYAIHEEKKNRNLNKKKNEASIENAEKKKRNAKKTDARYVEKR